MTNKNSGSTPQTVLDAMIASLAKAADYNHDDQVAPSAILWTDKDCQWTAATERLRDLLPHLLTYGEYNRQVKTGPAIWLRCMIAKTLPDIEYWPESATPILYLPGVSRQELRAVEDCPKPLQPIVELQYRGAFWSQKNARDWTILAFLASKEGGLGLDVARDTATLEAMKQSLSRLIDVPIAELQDKRLEAGDFHALLTPDPVRDLLSWMNDPKGVKNRWDSETWEAFRSVCKKTYEFDPQTDGDLVAGEAFGERQGQWSVVWDRFAESPKKYPRLPELLRKSKPAVPKNLFFRRDSWPQINEEMEDGLRKALTGLRKLTSIEAAKRIGELETEHSIRRTWVWAELALAPLASALGHLSGLGKICAKPIGGADLYAMAAAYSSGGWRADALALAALAEIESPADLEAISAAIYSIYRPWLEAAAEYFQKLQREKPCTESGHEGARPISADEGTCILFADGLRFDVGQKLKEFAVERGWQVEERFRWAALPPVTPTAKPAVSPIADLLQGEGPGEEFRPIIKQSGKTLVIDRFRQLLQERGYQVLSGEETGDPQGRAWAEYGHIDSYGHSHGWRVAQEVNREVRGLIGRIGVLLEAGWKKVMVVTDHGWLLLPGGLPKTDMPAYLTETRWGRCAVLKPGAKVEVPTLFWHWSKDVCVATPPGISAFKAGLEYAHGGLSIQECLVSEFTLTSGKPMGGNATIQSVKWVGMRCKVIVEGECAGYKVDIRTKAADPSTTVTKVKEVGADKAASLIVPDDSLKDTAVVIVLLSPEDQVIGKHSTTVGGED